MISHFIVFFEHCLRRTMLFFRDLPFFIKTPLLGRLCLYLSWHYFWRYSHSQLRFDVSKLGGDPQDYTLGITPLFSLHRVMKTALCLHAEKPTHSLVFTDLGCGLGNTVFYMRLAHQVTSVGVEINPSLHAFSSAAAAHFHLDRVSFILGDLFDQTIEHTDILYITTTCFSKKSFERLEQQCRACRPGTVIITTTTPFRDPAFVLIERQIAWFGWGRGYLYLHHRR